MIYNYLVLDSEWSKVLKLCFFIYFILLTHFWLLILIQWFLQYLTIVKISLEVDTYL